MSNLGHAHNAAASVRQKGLEDGRGAKPWKPPITPRGMIESACHSIYEDGYREGVRARPARATDDADREMGIDPILFGAGIGAK